MELRQIPAGDLYHHIVESRFKESTRGLGDRVFSIEETVAETKLGSDKGKRIARGL